MRKNVWIIGICIVCLLCGGYVLMNKNKANQYAEDMRSISLIVWKKII